METNTKRSNTVINVDRDDWIDENNMLHTKIVKEIIKGPMTNGLEPQRRPRMMMRHFSQLRPIAALRPQQQPAEVSQPKAEASPMPMIDFSKLIPMCKNIIDASGINFKDLNLKDVLGELSRKKSDIETSGFIQPAEEPIEEIDEPTKDSDESTEDSEEPTEDEENTAKAFLKEMIVPETKPVKKSTKVDNNKDLNKSLKSQKEVNKWKKTKKQNQRKKQQKK